MAYDWVTIAGPYKTRQLAEDVLEDMFSNGEIDNSTYPKVEKRGNRWYVVEREYY